MAKVNNLQTLLNSLAEQTSGETVTVADLLSAVGRRSYGPVLALLGFIAISPLTLIPGANWLVALVTLIFAGQMAVGKSYPWLPRRTLQFSFKREYLIQGIDLGGRYAYIIDQLLRPRLTFLTQPPFAQLVALICVVAALITFPLGFVPFGPLLPGLTVLLFGLAITGRDGVILLLALTVLIGSLLVLLRVWRALPFG